MKKIHFTVLAISIICCIALCGAGVPETDTDVSPAVSFADKASTASDSSKDTASTDSKDTASTDSKDASSDSAQKKESEALKECEQLLTNFQKAANQKNLADVVKCLNKDTLGNYLKGVEICDGSNKDTIAIITPYLNRITGNALEEVNFSDWKTMTLKPVSVKADDDDNYMLTYSLESENIASDLANVEISVPIVKIGNEWFFDVEKYDNMGSEKQPASYSVNEKLSDADVSFNLYLYDNGNSLYLLNDAGIPVMNDVPFSSIEGNFAGVSDGGSKYFAVKENGKYGFIDRGGNPAAGFFFTDFINMPAKGYYPVETIGTKGWNFYNPETGDGVLSSVNYIDKSCGTTDGFYYIKENYKYGLYSPSTQKSISCSYDELGQFDNGLIPAKKDGYWGLIDKDENVVLDFLYDKMNTSASNDCIGVSVNKAWGVINKDGDYILPLSTDFDTCMEITKDGLIIMKMESKGKLNIYNLEGEILYEGFDKITWLSPDRAIIEKSIKDSNPYTYVYNAIYYIIDENGELVFDISGYMEDKLAAESEHKENYYKVEPGIHEKNGFITVFASYHDGYYDILDYDGNSLIGGACFVPDHFNYVDSAYSLDEKIVSLSNYDGSTTFYVLDSDLEIQVDNCEVSGKSGHFGILNNNLIIKNKKGSDFKYDIEEDTLESYENISIVNEISCILYDGIYYGLYLGNGLYGDGFVYNKISSKDKGCMTIFTLEQGANKEELCIFHSPVDDYACIFNIDDYLDDMTDVIEKSTRGIPSSTVKEIPAPKPEPVTVTKTDADNKDTDDKTGSTTTTQTDNKDTDNKNTNSSTPTQTDNKNIDNKNTDSSTTTQTNTDNKNTDSSTTAQTDKKDTGDKNSGKTATTNRHKRADADYQLLVMNVQYGDMKKNTSVRPSLVSLDSINPETGAVKNYRTFSTFDTLSCNPCFMYEYPRGNTSAMEMLFNYDFTKMAAVLPMDDNSWHVGWIDERGNFTDVSSKVTPKDDFGGLTNHSDPRFYKGYFYFKDKTYNPAAIKRVPVNSLKPDSVEIVVADSRYSGLYIHADGSVADDIYAFHEYYDESMTYVASSNVFTDWISENECVGADGDMIYKYKLKEPDDGSSSWYWYDEMTPLVPDIKGRKNWNAVVSPECDRVAFLSELTTSADKETSLFIVPIKGGSPVKVNANYDFTDYGSLSYYVRILDWQEISK